MTEPFLKRVARNLLTDHGTGLDRLTVVVPSERAALFLKHYLIELAGKTIWSPRLITINTFIEQNCPYQIIDHLTLQFEFYEAYRQVEQDHAESFDQFLGWSTTFLSDLNEIERYLVPADKLFGDLRNIKELENWSLSEERLTEGQQQYATFWTKLGQYRNALHKQLLGQNMAYTGMAYRHVAKTIDELILETLDNTIYFVGFNALSASEEVIFKSLSNAGKATVLWDADEYYVTNEEHEAGLFFRRYQNWSQEFNWIGNNLQELEREVTVTGVPQSVLQAKVAGDLLSRIRPGITETTAIVLADETLLTPVLNSLPEAGIGYNITMGYPLHNSALHGFFMGMINLHQNTQRFASQGQSRIYHKDFLSLTFHPYFQLLITPHEPDFIKKAHELILGKNRIYLSKTDLEQLVPDEQLRIVFFEPTTLSARLVERMLKCIELLQLRFSEEEHHQLDLEYLFEYLKLLNRLNDLLTGYHHELDLKSFRKMFDRLGRSGTLSFFGEPLQGAQILGMLETRALDFENVILLSANEGVLPNVRHDGSFIPFDLKHYYKLPTQREKEAIYAHHFYHLVQRAKRIHIIYNTESDDLGGGERSRYVLQLEEELQKVNKGMKFTSQVIELPLSNTHLHQLEVPHTEVVKQRLLNWMASGVSPSAINTFIECPLDFYYKYVIGLRDLEEVEENVEASSLGTFIHDTLERLYKPVVGMQLTTADIDRMQQQQSGFLREEFNGVYKNEDLDQGKNLIALKVAERFVERFLNLEKEQLENGAVIEILGLEEELDHDTFIELEGQQYPIQFRGKADRIDRYNGTLRVIDYKTGKVEPRDLAVVELEELNTDKRKAKALQVLLYALLYQRKHPEIAEMQSCIISFRNLNAGTMIALINNEDMLNHELLQMAETQLKELISGILGTKTFGHDSNAPYCKFCN